MRPSSGCSRRDLLGEALRKPLAQLLFFSLLLVFLGGSGIVHSAPPGTRYAAVLKVALTFALAGGAAAALAPTVRALLPSRGPLRSSSCFAPTLSGHALDRNQPRLLSVAADFVHLTAAAVWLGGLLSLVYVVPRATDDEPTRVAVARRFSTVALTAVVVIGVTGIARALTELSAVHQIWSTSYGRALIAKTVLFIPLLGLGWLNRTLLLGVFARLRRSVLVELTLLVGIVIAVAVLTELRPGRDVSRALAATPSQPVAQPPVLPPRDAVVDARELGALGGRGRADARRSDDHPARRGRHGDLRPRACSSTAFAPSAAERAATAPRLRPGPLHVTVTGRTLTFVVPARAPDAQSTPARRHEAVSRGEDDRLRRVARLVADRRAAVALQRRRSRSSLVRDRRAVRLRS